MIDSASLLAAYAEHGDEAAFRAVVEGHLGLVYSTALRIVGGNRPLAEDAAQVVFARLAQNARKLSRHPTLAGWLHRDTFYTASKMARHERRRAHRESQSAFMNEPDSPPHDAETLARLDEAINLLSETDRAAILLRFFEQRDYRAVGAALGSSEDAARMRVGRALEKLQWILSRRGAAVSAAALGTVLSAKAAAAAPAGLASTVAASALASATHAGSATLLFKIMTITKANATVAGALLLAGATVTLFVERHAKIELDAENVSLRGRIEQAAQLKSDNERLATELKRATEARRRAESAAASAAARNASPPGSAAELAARINQGETPPNLTADQLKSYLESNHRNAGSLIAAFHTSGDEALLKEAMEKFPNDPQVDLAAVFKTDASPEERRQWIENFKNSAPDNSLPDYLSALDYFKAGQTDKAVAALTDAGSKPNYADYTLNYMQNDEEAYLGADDSPATAKVLSGSTLVLPYLAQLKALGNDVDDLAKTYAASGDTESAQAALQTAIELGQRFDGSTSPAGEPLITKLVGLAIERIAINQMDPAAPYGDSGLTVQQQADALKQQSDSLKALASQMDALRGSMTDDDWIVYRDRWRQFGEVNALNWLVSKYGPHN